LHADYDLILYHNTSFFCSQRKTRIIRIAYTSLFPDNRLDYHPHYIFLVPTPDRDRQNPAFAGLLPGPPG
jgi:hypothetical protein